MFGPTAGAKGSALPLLSQAGAKAALKLREESRDKRPPKTKRKSARKFLRRHRRVWPINKTFAPEVINPGWLRNSKSIIFCLKSSSSCKAGLVVVSIFSFTKRANSFSNPSTLQRDFSSILNYLFLTKHSFRFYVTN